MPKLTKRRRKSKVYRSYEEFIKEFFPKQWKNRDKVCIHCHQKIRKENLYQEIPITERKG